MRILNEKDRGVIADEVEYLFGIKLGGKAAKNISRSICRPPTCTVEKRTNTGVILSGSEKEVSFGDFLQGCARLEIAVRRRNRARAR